MLNPLAHHLTEELWSKFAEQSIAYDNWPFLAQFSKKEEMFRKIVVQINGKKNCSTNSFCRSEFWCLTRKKVKEDKFISSLLEDRKVNRIIIVKNKLVNILVGD